MKATRFETIYNTRRVPSLLGVWHTPASLAPSNETDAAETRKIIATILLSANRGAGTKDSLGINMPNVTRDLTRLCTLTTQFPTQLHTRALKNKTKHVCKPNDTICSTHAHLSERPHNAKTGPSSDTLLETQPKIEGFTTPRRRSIACTLVRRAPAAAVPQGCAGRLSVEAAQVMLLCHPSAT